MGRRGRLITVEGIDGSGKSTQARMLAERLEARGHHVVRTREPGGAPGAEEIRRLLLSGPELWSPETEILLFTAARRDHAERTLWPALEAGSLVISDRYVDSTRAYQGGDPARRALIDRLHREAVGLDPDLTLLFDLAPDVAARRRAGRGGAEDRFERRGAAFQATLQARFRALAAAEPGRIRTVDASGAAEAAAARALAEIAAAMALG